MNETLAEKVLSFLRRTAEARAGRQRATYDDRLVRHLYDVRAIVALRKNEIDAQVHSQFVTLIHGDAVQYRNQFPEFEEDPIGQMRQVLKALLQEPVDFERDYVQFVDELVFGETVPFAEARAIFVQLAEQLLTSATPPQLTVPEPCI